MKCIKSARLPWKRSISTKTDHVMRVRLSFLDSPDIFTPKTINQTCALKNINKVALSPGLQEPHINLIYNKLF